MKRTNREMVLETLSPVHVSSGNRLSPYTDFIYEEGRIYYIDTEKLFGKLGHNDKMIDEYVSIIGEKSGSTKNKYTLKNFFKEYDLNIKEYLLSRFDIIGGAKTNEIHEIAKSNGKPYIPGSSIKGAIRTALIYDSMIRKGYSFDSMCKLSNFSDSKTNSRKTYVGQDVLRKQAYNVRTDIMRFLQVSDTESINIDRMKIYREELVDLAETLKQKKLVRKSPVLTEAIPEGVSLDFSLKSKARYFDDIKDDFDFLKEGREKELFSKINAFYFKLINHHIKRLEESSRELFSDIISRYNLLLNMANGLINKQNGFILRVGSHKSFLDNTVSLSFSPADMEKVKSRVAGSKSKIPGKGLFPKTEWFIYANEGVKEVPGWAVIRLC
jgi:CRISPR-associated protein Csm5